MHVRYAFLFRSFCVLVDYNIWFGFVTWWSADPFFLLMLHLYKRGRDYNATIRRFKFLKMYHEVYGSLDSAARVHGAHFIWTASALYTHILMSWGPKLMLKSISRERILICLCLRTWPLLNYGYLLRT